MEKIKKEIVLLKGKKQVWHLLVEPTHVKAWFALQNDWHGQQAVNSLREGGEFLYQMASKNAKELYELKGTISKVDPGNVLQVDLREGRTLSFALHAIDPTTTRVEFAIDPETKNTVESQKRLWDELSSQFESYVERH